MAENLSDHKRLAQIREMPQGADEWFLLRLIWEYEQAMRSAKSELDLVSGAPENRFGVYMLNARRILRDALADKIEHSDVVRARRKTASEQLENFEDALVESILDEPAEVRRCNCIARINDDLAKSEFPNND